MLSSDQVSRYVKFSIVQSCDLLFGETLVARRMSIFEKPPSNVVIGGSGQAT
jgi:hypothetical protein